MINLETIKQTIENQINRHDTDLVILNRTEASIVYGILVTMLSRAQAALGQPSSPQAPTS